MNNLINWDTSIVVDDYVFCKYKGYDRIYKVVSIERRFLTADQVKWATHPSHQYYGAQVGEEYTPRVHIQLAATLEYKSPADTRKLRRTGAKIDGAYLIKVNPNILAEHVNRLTDLIVELFP